MTKGVHKVEAHPDLEHVEGRGVWSEAMSNKGSRFQTGSELVFLRPSSRAGTNASRENVMHQTGIYKQNKRNELDRVLIDFHLFKIMFSAVPAVCVFFSKFKTSTSVEEGGEAKRKWSL